MSTQTDSELSPQYDAASVEGDIYARWIDAGIFTARAERVGAGRPPFLMMMPPPNGTAVLHMGHGFNHTVRDVRVRWRCMSGVDAGGFA